MQLLVKIRARECVIRVKKKEEKINGSMRAK